jgi:hypothetical protein
MLTKHHKGDAMNTFYRYIQITVLAVIFTMLSFAQNPIPNPGFENWTGGNPDGWTSLNVPGYSEPVMQSNDSHSGTYAVKGEVLNIAEENIPPIFFYGSSQFDISLNYTRLTGYYQMTNMGEDVLLADVYFYDAQSNPVALGFAELESTSGGYQMFTVDMVYSVGSHQPVAGAFIFFQIVVASSSSLEDITAGSSFLLDDIAFDMVVTSLDDQKPAGTPLVFALAQNYPNPFNPATKISFSLPTAEKAVLTVYNSLGQVIKTLLNENLAAGLHQVSFDAVALPSGIYYYKLEAGTYSSVKRMLLVK